MELELGFIENDRIILIRLVGTVGNGDIPGLYDALNEAGLLDDPRPYLVDGRLITEVTLQRGAMEVIASDLRKHENGYRERRVAFLADRDLTFGMFRMWEAQRAGVGGKSGVFRDEAEAVAWVLAGD